MISNIKPYATIVNCVIFLSISTFKIVGLNMINYVCRGISYTGRHNTQWQEIVNIISCSSMNVHFKNRI